MRIVIRAKDEFSKAFNKASKSLKSFQKAAITATAIGVGIAFAFGKAIKTTIDFETAFTGVRKTVELTEKGFADLENRFKEITKTTPITFVELSRIGEIAGQLGVTGVDNIAKFTKTIADITQATELTAEQAALDFARIASIMEEPLDNIDRMGSSVVALGNKFETSEAEILTFSQRIAASGKGAKLSTADIFGISAAFTSVGIQAERGGTAVSKVIDAMVQAVAEGGNKLDVFASTAGLTAEEFSRVFKEDAANAFELFVLGIGKQGDDVFKTFEALELQDQRLVQSFRAVAGAGDKITRTIGESSIATEENTALVEEAEKRYETLQSKIDIAKNKFALLGDEIGLRIVPFIEDKLLPALDFLIDTWDNLSPKMQDAILIFAGVTAVIFLLAGAIALITLVSSPWLLILFAIAGAISLLIIFWDEVVTAVQKGIIAIIFAAQTLRDFWILVWAAVSNAAISSWNLVVTIIEKSINKVIDIINFLIEGLNLIKGVSIAIIPSLDLSNIKGELTDLGELNARLKADRIATGQELVRRAGIEINIENVNGVDAEDISRALSEELNLKQST